MTVELHLPLDGRVAREARAAALAAAEARFPEVAQRFNAAYGMQLPRHVLYAAAFFLGLSPEEQRLCPCSLFGFLEWFQWLAPGEPERTATLDGRLEGRFRRDPPEFVTIVSGDGDGSHWGLFYDDPNALPTLVAHGWARDDGVVRPEQRTILASIRAKVSQREGLDADDKRRVRAIVGYLDALRDLEERARTEEGIPIPPTSRVEVAHGGVGVHLPGWTMPADLPSGDERWRHYVDEAPTSRARVGEWVARAETELAAGAPGLALVLGLELHHADRDATREDCTRILVAAYEALGRHPLAEIARVHHAHRDLRSVGVHARAEDVAAEPQPEWVPPPVLVAVQALDPDALDEALLADPPHADLCLAGGAVATRFQHHDAKDKAVALAMLERLLVIGKEELASSILAEHLIQARRCLDAEYLARVSTRRDPTQTKEIIGMFLAAKDLTAVERIVAHGGRARAPLTVEFAICTGDVDLATAAIEAVPDLADHRGHYSAQSGWIADATLLHFAVCSASPRVVELLLDRGLDPELKESAGNSPRDLAKMLWFVKPNEANRMIELFDAKLPKAVVAEAPPSFVVGAKVSHKKFGDGTVDKIDGQGDEAKVTVRFGAETKTLQRRFLSLVG